MARKICQLPTCNKPFIAVTHNQKYCCKKCRLIAAEERVPKKQGGRRPNPKTGQPCWRCQRACGKCPWSKNFKPIKGWIAKKVKRKDVYGTTYNISFCPLFLEDVD